MHTQLVARLVFSGILFLVHSRRRKAEYFPRDDEMRAINMRFLKKY